MHTTTRAFAFALGVVAAATVVGCGTPARHTILWPSGSAADTPTPPPGGTVHEVRVTRVDIPNRLFVGTDGRVYEIAEDTVVYDRLIPMRWDKVQPGQVVVILQGPEAPAPSALPR